MRFVIFIHSLVSDWNHGNAHFLRGVCRELIARGHELRIFEPQDGWSRANLVADQGEAPLARFAAAFPDLRSETYDPDTPDLDRMLDGADVVLVHEWSEPNLVAAIGRRRAQGGCFRLLFHDTHHRSVSQPEAMAAYDLSAYDGVLAFGEAIREVYVRQGWARNVWTWHEAADIRLFRPPPEIAPERDLIWIGNWGDGERNDELRRFLLDPVRDLGLSATVRGVRYPDDAKAALAEAGVDYRGWIANYDAPEAFARHRVTMHVPRRFYAETLPGIPTIRVFEALACGIPLISAPWNDAEGLFRVGQDFIQVADGGAMTAALRELLADPARRAELARNGRETILARHSCAHRADELLDICARLDAPSAHGEKNYAGAV